MKKLLLALSFSLLFLTLPAGSYAAETPPKQILPTSPLYLIVQIKESIQSLLTFDQTAKVELLEQFVDQRIQEINYATAIGNESAATKALDRFEQQKTQALKLAQASGDQPLVERLEERTVEQQREMTQIQLQSENTVVQEKIVEVQKSVAENTVEVVQDIVGEAGAAATEEKIVNIWRDPNADVNGNLPPLPENWEYAPGTEGRDGTGKVIIEGDASTWAPGAEGAGEGGVTVEGNPSQWAPGTKGAGEGDVKVEGNQPGVYVAP